MVKKLFALASVTALTGLVSAATSVGCSDDNSATGGDAATDARRETGPVTPGDEEPEPKSCMVTTPLDFSAEPYAPPNIHLGVCTDANFQALLDYLNAQLDKADKGDKEALKFTNTQWAEGAKLSTECAACVFTKDNASNWGAIIGDKVKDTFVNYNWGGCMNVVTGSEQCGKTFQQLYECRLEACAPCTTESEATGCYQDGVALFGTGGPCETAFAAAETACGGDAPFQAAQKKCSALPYDYTFQNVADLFCGTGGGLIKPDGGADGGSNDAGNDASNDASNDADAAK
jgi:hypothetical protein